MKKAHSIFWTPFVSIILFMTSFHTVEAQVEKDTILASQYFKKADSLLIDRKHEKSIELFEKALLIYEKADDQKKVISCYNKISRNSWFNADYEKSIYYAEKVLDANIKIDVREKANAYDNIGKCFEQMADYKKALINYHKALDLRNELLPENHPDKASSYLNIGIVYYRTDKIDKAISSFKKALVIKINTEGEYHLDNVALYNNLANMYYEFGEFEEALQYCDKALLILNKKKHDFYLSGIYHTKGRINYFLGNINKAIEFIKKSCSIREKIYPGHPKLALSYQNLSLYLLENKDYEKALAYLQKSLTIYKNKLGDKHTSIAEVYFYMSNIYAKTNNFSKAIDYLNLSTNIEKQALGENHTTTAENYREMGVIYLKKGNHITSLDYYKKALNIYTNVYGTKHRRTAMLFNDIGDLYFIQKDLDTSLDYYLKAQTANSKKGRKNNSDIDFELDNYLDKNILLTSITGQAKTYQKLYLQDKNSSYLTNAIQKYQLTDTLIQTIRQSFTNYQDKVAFAKQAKEIYQEAIETVLLQKNPQSLEQAFYYAEKSKANTLKELLNDAGAKNYSGLPTDLVALEKELRINRSLYQSQITEELSNKEVDTSKIRDFENELFITNRRQDSLTKILEKNYPKYHQLKYRNDIVSVSEIQQKLDDKTTLVSFFTGDSVTHTFTISKKNISVQQLPTPKLAKQIEEFRKSIIAKDVQKHKKQAYALYTKLIAPIQDKLVGEELIIIPDGPLWHLNFEVLVSKKDDSNNPALLSYLLKDYAISYANSATLLFTPFKESAQSETLQECLAFSFSDSTNIAQANTMRLATLRDTGADLPGTRKEIRAISNIIDGEYYYGSQAIESNFKKNAGKYNILHLALHGDVDNERPENSKLYFTKSKDTLEDNLLYSHELFALDIPAELTVLSACNTGSGKIAKGEGIMSLGTAFQYAGTKSLLLTSWEVSDQTTPEVMKYFYTNLKAGMNKAKALQQAKLQYLTTANINRTDPFYWGAFYLVGDSAPIPFESNTLLYWSIAILILVLSGGLLWYRKKLRPKN